VLKHKKNGDSIRVWVPGCSTGEEVYSIGICLLETLADQAPGLQCQIFATDISEPAIEKARAGFYGENIKEDVSTERLRRFFVRTAEGYRISKMVRDVCIFARQDLTKDPPFSRLDLISCRNVLIYMGSDLQKRIIPIFHYALKPNGYLMLGSAESTGSFANLFALADQKGKIYSKKMAGLDLRGDPAFALKAAPPKLLPWKESRDPEPPSPEVELFREADKITLSRYAPAGVLLNDALEVLQFRGHTGPFLEHGPGKPTVSLLKLVREGLVFELKAAVAKAVKEHVPVRSAPVELRSDGHSRQVVIDVVPIKAGGEKPYLLVLFQESQPSVLREAKTARMTSREESKLVAQLRRELNALREELQSMIEEQEAAQEEFKSANEEILSSNEELQSTNEELETAKEELQSANEELTTLNEELLTRNTELGQINSDITNLLSSTSIPILMLSQDLKIRRFTPTAAALLNLIPGDIGRPISNINPNINLASLEKSVSLVVDTMTLSDQEVRSKDGKWFSMRIRPYRTVDNRIDGVTLTFHDIEALKRGQEAEAVVETIREPLIILDAEFRIKSANRSFFRVFATTEEETINRPLFELGNGQWNIPALKTLLEEILPKRTTVEDYRVEHEFPGIGRRVMMLNARRVKRDHTPGDIILVAIEDVTGKK